MLMLPTLLSTAAIAMPHMEGGNATHGAPEYMGAGAFSADFEGMTFGAKVSASGGTPMQLHMMTDKGLKGAGAVCLDGSDAGFYFAPATNAKNKNDWQLYFQGPSACPPLPRPLRSAGLNWLRMALQPVDRQLAAL
eukprot:COSAG02_NODE_181_length_30783_cov_53.060520_19_plen_136_part_00